MPTFPFLKTGAVMQYPAGKSTQYASHVVRFVDGSDQRFREFKSPQRKWVIKLELLDEEEVGVLQRFFVDEAGQFGNFTFTDPWTQVSYPTCSFDAPAFDVQFQAENRAAGNLVIVENRT